ncbi:MAG: 4-alpha-glucanotransferase [bacterium]
MKNRKSGLLLHITSLPSAYGIGDLGEGAYKFADFLARSKQSLWQVLPINPTSQYSGNSPYSVNSAFAGNPLLISPELLYKDGLLNKDDFTQEKQFPVERVAYAAVIDLKNKLLNRAFLINKGRKKNNEAVKFYEKNKWWLDDYALFIAINEKFGGILWHKWTNAIRDREQQALNEAKKDLFESIEQIKFEQFIFCKQYFELKRYCNDKNIKFIGDMPIYVDYQSADVWAHSEIFKLGPDKKSKYVAGVPPDYFSSTGQLWNNPVYNWEYLKDKGYPWWIERVKHNLNLFDYVRVDHFIGLVAYWEIPYGARTAMKGRYSKSYGEDLFFTLRKEIPALPIIAEDLGVITQQVKDAMGRLGFPGMKILQFAFGKDMPDSMYIPHNYNNNCVVYTGTHDNNTVKGWFKEELSKEDRKRLFKYLGAEVDESEINWKLIRLAMLSVGDTVIIPMQDVLGLDSRHRLNTPSTAKGNWEWRLDPSLITSAVERKLLKLTCISGRV